MQSERRNLRPVAIVPGITPVSAAGSDADTPGGTLQPALRRPLPSPPLSQPAPSREPAHHAATPSWHPDLDRAVCSFAARLKRKFAAEIVQDQRAFKKAALHLLRLHLPPGPGRVPEAAVTKAIELRSLGTPWQDIYPVCIPDYTSLTPAGRSEAASRLRTARRARINTRKRRLRSYRQSAPPLR